MNYLITLTTLTLLILNLLQSASAKDVFLIEAYRFAGDQCQMNSMLGKWKWNGYSFMDGKTFSNSNKCVKAEDGDRSFKSLWYTQAHVNYKSPDVEAPKYGDCVISLWENRICEGEAVRVFHDANKEYNWGLESNTGRGHCIGNFTAPAKSLKLQCKMDRPKV